MNRKLRADLMLLTTALIWGTAFVAQKSGMDLIGPVAFNGIRTFIGGLVLLPVIWLFSKRKKKDDPEQEELSPEEAAEAAAKERKLLIIGGIACGIALCLAGTVQQIGLYYTTAGKTGFITALYVVLVPIFGLFLRKKVRPIIWVCALASAIGLYLLCIPAEGGFGHINKGDLIILVCAALFAIHILIIDYFSPKVDGVKLSCIQFFVGGIVAIILIFPLDPALGFDLPTVEGILGTWFPLLYVGVLSCGVAYTFQVVAQADTDPAVASMILCLESVFAVIAGAILLGESMGVQEILGCIIIFVAIVVAQLPSKESRLQK